MPLTWPDTHCPHAPPLQVVPVLLQLTRGADDLQRRVDMVRGHAGSFVSTQCADACALCHRCSALAWCGRPPPSGPPFPHPALPLSAPCAQVRALTDLVILMRQHVRKFLPDLLALVNDFWTG